MKKISVLLAALINISLLSCDSTHTDKPVSEQASAHSGAHIYTCPMHPEVQSGEPGTCPKCGMKLEHTDGAVSGKKYTVKLKTEPATLEAGKPGVLYFRPVEENRPEAPVPLDVVHEKKMHLIIVSRDLSYFEHVHPQYTADGSYEIKVLPGGENYSQGKGNHETQFPEGGEYILFQDYKPSGAGGQVSRILLDVKGPAGKAEVSREEKLTWRQGAYEARLSLPSVLKAGESAILSISLTKDSKPVTNLENYLGALGHMVVISEDTKEYLHVHPEESKERGPRIAFHSHIEKPGTYRVFLQFRHQEELHTADFTIKAGN
jgi:hypothetical protein